VGSFNCALCEKNGWAVGELQPMLSRALSSTEAQWLAMGGGSGSPLCLCAAVAPEWAAQLPGALEAALVTIRARHPFLQVCLGAAAAEDGDGQPCLRPSTSPIPVSSEVLPADACAADVHAAVQRQLAQGFVLATSFVRVHLLLAASGGVTHMLLLGDHMVVDGKSLAIWLTEVVVHCVEEAARGPLSSAPAPVAASGEPDESSLLVDWTTRVPPLDLPPFVSTATVLLTSLPGAAEAAAVVPPPVVRDVVVTLAPNVFVALRAQTKARGATMNAPLMAAFCAAVADTATWQQDVSGGSGSGSDLRATGRTSVRTLCAVDTRRFLVPPLPADFIGNIAGVVPCAMDVGLPAAAASGDVGSASADSDGADLWRVALTAQSSVVASADAGEAFRLRDITVRGAWAEMVPLFSIPCMWSNIGHIAGGEGAVVTAVEFHMTGAGTNPIVSGHCVEMGGKLALTITYAASFHSEDTIHHLCDRFQARVLQLAHARMESVADN
jgi:hypothetical protein